MELADHSKKKQLTFSQRQNIQSLCGHPQKMTENHIIQMKIGQTYLPSKEYLLVLELTT